MSNNQVIANAIAESIKSKLIARTNDNIRFNTLTTSFALHISLEAIADTLHVDLAQFKRDCGVGQPLAYFI